MGEEDGTVLLTRDWSTVLQGELEAVLVRGTGTGAGRIGTGGLTQGLSLPILVEAAGRDVVLPDMPLVCAAAEAKFGRAGTGGGIFRLTGTGGASVAGALGALGVVGNARDEAA